jgi:hypothetical protein
MLFRIKNNSAACVFILGLAVLLPGMASSLAAESLVSPVAVAAAAAESRATPDAPLAPVNAAAVESAEPTGSAIQVPEPPSSFVSAIGFLYLCAGFFFFRRRKNVPRRYSRESDSALQPLGTYAVPYQAREILFDSQRRHGTVCSGKDRGTVGTARQHLTNGLSQFGADRSL